METMELQLGKAGQRRVSQGKKTTVRNSHNIPQKANSAYIFALDLITVRIGI